MCDQLIIALEGIVITNGECDTQTTGNNHQLCCLNVLNQHNFINCTSLSYRNGCDNLADGLYYCDQPNGSQNSPDIILMRIVGGIIVTSINLELKSGNKRIMWNDGYAKKDSIYLYYERKVNESILIDGDVLMSDDDRDKLVDIIDKLQQMKIMIRDTFNKTNTVGWRCNLRRGDSQNIDIDNYRTQVNKSNIKKKLELLYIPIGMPIQPDGKHDMKVVDTDPRPKAISLFSGAGGDTIGMTNANINVVGFVEFDNHAIQTHQLNHPNCKLIGRDITTIPNRTLREYKDKIDIIFGGFPCQSFSQGGKKKADDPRGQLYMEFVRFAAKIRPKFIMGENVNGLLRRKNSDGGLIMDDIIGEFNTIGYAIKYQIVKSEKFGVAQTRSRVFIIGIRNDLDIDIRDVTIPTTNGRTKTLRSICEFSLEDALLIEKEHILAMIPPQKCIHSDDDSKVRGVPPTNLVKCYNETNQHGFSFGKRAKPTFSGIEDLDARSHTILCTYNRMPRLFVPISTPGGVYLRPFTVNELQQIQDFPPDYKFSGKKSDQIKQIGNAVPPIIVTCVCNYILSL